MQTDSDIGERWETINITEMFRMRQGDSIVLIGKKDLHVCGNWQVMYLSAQFGTIQFLKRLKYSFSDRVTEQY